MNPTIGRIVHYYTTNKDRHSNGIGQGPYPAIVTQVFTDPDGEVVTFANLKVFPPFAGTYDIGSVREKAKAQAEGAPMWWEWSPRV